VPQSAGVKPIPIVAGLVLVAIGAGAYLALTGAHRRAASSGSSDEQWEQPPPPSEAIRKRDTLTEGSSVPSSGEIPPTLAKMIRDLQASTDSRDSVWAGVLLVGWSDFGKGVAAIRRNYAAAEAGPRIVHLFSTIHEHTLDNMAAHLAFLSTDRERASVAGSVARQWARRDPAAVELLVAHLTGEVKAAAVSEAVRVLIESGNFGGASHLVHSLSPSREKSTALRQLASRWAREHPGIALQWSRSLNSEDDRRAAESGILEASGLTREEITALTNASADPVSGAAAINSVADRMVQSDLQLAMQWLTQVPARFRPGVQQRIAIKLAESDPARGTAYALAIEDSDARDSSLDAINSELLSRNPDTAVQWLQELPPESQERAAFNTVSLWYDMDSAQVSRWIDTLDAGDLKDQALLALSSKLAQTNPDAARNAARQIGDPDLRTTALDDL
jgi:hypothetical protein